MGIQGLLPLLKSVTEHSHVKHCKGQTIGVDAYVWLHKGAFGCAQELALGKTTTKYVDYAMHRVRMLQHYGIIPYIVFDGDYLPSKAKTERERAAKRKENTRLGREAMAQGNKRQALEHFQRAIDVTTEMAAQFIRALREANVLFVVAPYEADAQLAYLDRINLIDGVITEDSDLIVFGCKKVLYKLNEFGECREIVTSRISDNVGLKFTGWNQAMFRYMAILSGCDYLDNLPGMGLKTAHTLVRRYRTIDRIFYGLRLDHRVSPEYEADFRRADNTFLHQMIYCPLRKVITMSNEPEHSLDEQSLRLIGIKHEDHIAVDIAEGHVCPITRKPFARPLLKHSQSAPVGTRLIDSYLQPLQSRDINVQTKRIAPKPSERDLTYAKKLRMFETSPEQPRISKVKAFFQKTPAKATKEDLDIAAAIEASKAEEERRKAYEGFENPIAFELAPAPKISPFFEDDQKRVQPVVLPTECSDIDHNQPLLPTPPDSQTQLTAEWKAAFTCTTSSFTSSLHRLGGKVLARRVSTPSIPQRQPFVPSTKFMR